MKVTAIMATCGRHYCAERSLSLFLEQDYQNKHLLIYQNSNVYQALDITVEKQLVTLVNNHIDNTTQKPYCNLGAIYADAITYIPADTEILVFWDDDDLFLNNHLTEGVKGLVKGGKIAYKPYVSFFRHPDTTITTQENTFEPSIFVKAEHIYKYGFSQSTTDQHLQWVNPLIENDGIFVDKTGKPTLIYNWSDSFDTFKTSADYQNPNNFRNYRKYSTDHGDKIISPANLSEYLFLKNLH